MVVTGTLFAVLATILIANVAPGRNVLLHKTALVVLAPLVWIVGVIGRSHLWPFSEKAGVPAAILLGFLTLLVSLLYAAVLTWISKLIRSGMARIMPNNPSEATSQ